MPERCEPQYIFHRPIVDLIELDLPIDRQLAYAQSFWICTYIEQKYGHDAILKMLDLYRAQLGPAECPGKAQQKQRSVTQPGEAVLACRYHAL